MKVRGYYLVNREIPYGCDEGQILYWGPELQEVLCTRSIYLSNHPDAIPGAVDVILDIEFD